MCALISLYHAIKIYRNKSKVLDIFLTLALFVETFRYMYIQILGRGLVIFLENHFYDDAQFFIIKCQYFLHHASPTSVFLDLPNYIQQRYRYFIDQVHVLHKFYIARMNMQTYGPKKEKGDNRLIQRATVLHIMVKECVYVGGGG